MKPIISCSIASALCLLGNSAVGKAQEEPVSLAKIPAKVLRTLHARFPHAKIDNCVKEKEAGAVVYDIEFKENGRKCESDIREDGTYINFEKAIPAKDLPAAVRVALMKRYPKATMKEIMEETEVHGKSEELSAYEVVLVTAGKKHTEVRFSPAGKVLEVAAEPKKEKK